MSKSDCYKMFPESICSALRDLVSFEQFKNREKHPWRSVNFNFTKISTPPWVFFTFVKLCTWYQIVQNITCIKSEEAEERKSNNL